MLNSSQLEFIYADKYIRSHQSLSKKHVKIRMLPNLIPDILRVDHEFHECPLQIKDNASHKHRRAKFNIQTCLKSLGLIYGLDAMITGVNSSITRNN